MEILIGLLPWVVIFSIVFMLISRTKRKQKVKSTHIVRIRSVNGIFPMKIVGDEEGFDIFNPLIKKSIIKNNLLDDSLNNDTSTDPTYSYFCDNVYHSANKND